MPEIENLTVEKQEGPELCWAASIKCVLDCYLSAKAVPTQQQLWTRFGKVEGGERKQANAVTTVLKAIGALHSVDWFNADPGESVRYTLLGVKISDHIRRKQPIICGIQGTGKNNTFLHGLVIWKVHEMPAPMLYMKDPARPGVECVVELGKILRGEWEYQPYLKVYAMQFVFTERPSPLELAAAGLLER